MWAKLFQDLLKDCDREIYFKSAILYMEENKVIASRMADVLKLGNVLKKRYDIIWVTN